MIKEENESVVDDGGRKSVEITLIVKKSPVVSQSHSNQLCGC